MIGVRIIKAQPTQPYSACMTSQSLADRKSYIAKCQIWFGSFAKGFHLQNIVTTFLQFYSPAETKEYQDAISAVRKLGRDQIEARIKAIESGQETPTDLLNHILQLACKLMMPCAVRQTVNVCSSHMQL